MAMYGSPVARPSVEAEVHMKLYGFAPTRTIPKAPPRIAESFASLRSGR
jgi:hypothetical protein